MELKEEVKQVQRRLPTTLKQVEQIKQMKTDCEQLIYKAISDFENKSDCVVDRIELTHIKMAAIGISNNAEILTDIRLDVRLR